MNNSILNKFDKKKGLIIIIIFLIFVSLVGGTFAYWGWTTNESQRTNIVVEVPDVCRINVDGGGSINSSSISMVPATCTNTNHAIIKEINMKVMFPGSDLPTNVKLWLEVDEIAEELSATSNFKYALTSSSTDCVTNAVVTGSFSGVGVGDVINLFEQDYSGNLGETVSDKYYLYIWLDAAETSYETAGKSFKFTLNGECVTEMG